MHAARSETGQTVHGREAETRRAVEPRDLALDIPPFDPLSDESTPMLVALWVEQRLVTISRGRSPFSKNLTMCSMGLGCCSAR